MEPEKRLSLPEWQDKIAKKYRYTSYQQIEDIGLKRTATSYEAVYHVCNRSKILMVWRMVYI